MIYFFEAVGADAVKIGFTDDRDVTRRLSGVQTGNHLEIRTLKTIPGSERDEAFLHYRWRAAHIRREWFKLSLIRGEIMALEVAIPEPDPDWYMPMYMPNYDPDQAWDEYFTI